MTEHFGLNSRLPPGEGGLAFRAAVSPVSGVQLHMTIAATFVLEQSVAPTASIRHLIAVALQSTQSSCCITLI